MHLYSNQVNTSSTCFVTNEEILADDTSSKGAVFAIIVIREAIFLAPLEAIMQVLAQQPQSVPVVRLILMESYDIQRPQTSSVWRFPILLPHSRLNKTEHVYD